jgi:RimJ/RimL family protein N-acetyltransferase
MANPELSLRPVTMADAQMLLDWRNDPLTRQNSRTSTLVSRTEHETWLARTLASADYIVRIAEASGEPVGVIRADRTAAGWELSWTVAPQARERGHGGRMLKRFAAGLDGRLTAVIGRNNSASARIAAKAGFVRATSAADQPFEAWCRE